MFYPFCFHLTKLNQIRHAISIHEFGLRIVEQKVWNELDKETTLASSLATFKKSI